MELSWLLPPVLLTLLWGLKALLPGVRKLQVSPGCQMPWSAVPGALRAGAAEPWPRPEPPCAGLVPPEQVIRWKRSQPFFFCMEKNVQEGKKRILECLCFCGAQNSCESLFLDIFTR